MKTSSQYGFATFFKENEKYYFQFNDEEGQPILFSHAYQSEKSRDNGIQAVIRSVRKDPNIDFKKTKKEEHYFILKSGNHQEIARSKVFSTQEEMEQKLEVVMAIGEDVPIFPLATQLPDKKESAPEKTKAQVTKQEFPQRKGQETAEVKTPAVRQRTPEKMPRYKFSLIYYPDSSVWKIKHDQSGESEEFKRFSGRIVEGFVNDYLPEEDRKKAETEAPVRKKAVPPAGIPVAETAELQIRTYTREVVQYFVPAATLNEVELIPKSEKPEGSLIFNAKVTAKSLDKAKSFVIGEVKEQAPIQGKLLVPIYQANRLQPGLYRFTAVIEEKAEEGEAVARLSGTRLVYLN